MDRCTSLTDNDSVLYDDRVKPIWAGRKEGQPEWFYFVIDLNFLKYKYLKF